MTAQRRKREKEQRYQTILQTAERLFCENGYSNTKIQDIAQAAEVAVGTVYFYFRNKEDLLLQLLDATAFNVRNILGEAFRSGKTPVERFENAGRALFREFLGPPSLSTDHSSQGIGRGQPGGGGRQEGPSSSV